MKNILVISLVLLGVVFLAGCGQQQLSKNQPPSSPGNTTSSAQKSDDITNWQTYQSPDYGFEIKHPKEWTEKASSTKGVILDLSADRAQSMAVTYHEKITDMPTTYTSLAEYMSDASFENATAIEFKGDDGFTATLTSKIGSQNIVQKFIVIEHNKHIYVINYVDDSQYTAIKKQISDTLTFTK